MTNSSTCVVYCRISKDHLHDELGVQRQEKECREMCDRLGIGVDTILVDDDRSAYTGKPRPGYVAMLAGIAAGRWSTMVAWHPDRLTRHPRELEDLIDLLEQHAVTVHTVRAGEYDLATPTGRMMARVVGAVARHESEHKSDRIRSAARQLAEMGKVGGGGARPFGWEPDRVTIRETEAEALRLMVQWLLAGVTLGTIARRLNAGDVPTAGGNRWTPTALRRTMLTARNAGLREHLGRIVGPAVWPGIIDTTTYGQLVGLLADDTRRRNWHPRPYLLTGGLARCGVCGGTLISRPRSNGERCYICPSVTDARPGCGKIRRLAEPVEAEVLARLFSTIAALPAIVPPVNVAQVDAETEVARIDAALAQLARDHYADRVIGRAAFLAAHEALTAQAATVRAGMARPPRRTVAVPGDLPAAWATMEHDDRRALLADWIDAVVIHPAVKGLNRFDPSKVEVLWAR